MSETQKTGEKCLCAYQPIRVATSGSCPIHGQAPKQDEHSVDDVISMRTALTKLGIASPSESNEWSHSMYLSASRKIANRIREGIYETPRKSDDRLKEAREIIERFHRSFVWVHRDEDLTMFPMVAQAEAFLKQEDK